MRRNVQAKFWLVDGEKPIIGGGKANLLKTIDREGSLNKACEVLNISYKHAWLQVKEIEKAIGEAVLDTKRGGKLQGSRLTPRAKKLLTEYDSYRNLLEQTLHDKTFWELIGLKITARNQLKGKVTAIEKDQITAKVRMHVQAADLTAVITREAAEALEIKEDDEVAAIIKATEIMIGKEE
ncbi:molybdenum-dependent transcriptional regulator [Methanosarcinales archaeon ex4484_138]|nr:MAG: molybdenum-dependent transcriptional regulator [Methanosarcinales archaeon ex4484_138]